MACLSPLTTNSVAMSICLHASLYTCRSRFLEQISTSRLLGWRVCTLLFTEVLWNCPPVGPYPCGLGEDCLLICSLPLDLLKIIFQFCRHNHLIFLSPCLICKMIKILLHNNVLIIMPVNKSAYYKYLAHSRHSVNIHSLAYYRFLSDGKFSQIKCTCIIFLRCW